MNPPPLLANIILSDRSEFNSCISVGADMQFIAKYQDLTLRSVYQPIFDRSMCQIGVEALERVPLCHT